jgi:hypothetical protein
MTELKVSVWSDFLSLNYDYDYDDERMHVSSYIYSHDQYCDEMWTSVDESLIDVMVRVANESDNESENVMTTRNVRMKRKRKRKIWTENVRKRKRKIWTENVRKRKNQNQNQN